MTTITRSNWQILGPLIDRVLDLPPSERSRWIDTLSRQSPTIASEVSSFLAEEALADRSGFLGETPHPSLEGLEIGAYRLERPLGRLAPPPEPRSRAAPETRRQWPARI
jgi:hypothetical protein